MSKSNDDIDPRERHIRGLAFLMTKRGYLSNEVLEFVDQREFGLALQALAAEVKDES